MNELIVIAKEDVVKLAKNLVTAKGYADIRKAFSDQPPYVAIDMLVEFVKKNELTAPNLQKYMALQKKIIDEMSSKKKVYQTK